MNYAQLQDRLLFIFQEIVFHVLKFSLVTFFYHDNPYIYIFAGFTLFHCIILCVCKTNV